VADRAAMERVVSEVVARWGRVDVLVNNAALNRPGGVFTQTDADWDAVIAVNLTGAFIATSVAAGAMKDAGRGGSIVNVGSIGANGFGAAPAYAASKAGLIGLTRQAAVELGPLGITVNLVAPGVTTTEWVEKNLGQARIEASAANTPLRRAGTPADVASVVCYLASAGARHVTGQVVSVSGGVWMP
jgi:3-oxoacyl-[acyl-carrier protein] reductase